MTIYEGIILVVDSLILVGVWLELWLAWKVLSIRRRESIKRLVNKTLRSILCKRS